MMKKTVFLLLLMLAVKTLYAQFTSGEWTYVSFVRPASKVSAGSSFVSDPLIKDIPFNGKHEERFALIIGNENYASGNLGLQNVDYAVNDARAFREYALRFWGIPAENIFYLENATAGLMQATADRLALRLKNVPENAEVYFYFSGHGVQNSSGGSFIPAAIDNDPMNCGSCPNIYSTLEKLSRNGGVRVIAFTDACFSGRTRQGNNTIAVRGIRYEMVKGALPDGVILFAGAQENQYAFSWDEKKHGLFTAVLLEQLRKTNGSSTWSETAELIKKEVMDKAARLHFAAQEPVLTGSPQLLNQFQRLKIRR